MFGRFILIWTAFHFAVTLLAAPATKQATVNNELLPQYKCGEIGSGDIVWELGNMNSYYVTSRSMFWYDDKTLLMVNFNSLLLDADPPVALEKIYKDIRIFDLQTKSEMKNPSQELLQKIRVELNARDHVLGLRDYPPPELLQKKKKTDLEKALCRYVVHMGPVDRDKKLQYISLFGAPDSRIVGGISIYLLPSGHTVPGPLPHAVHFSPDGHYMQISSDVILDIDRAKPLRLYSGCPISKTALNQRWNKIALAMLGETMDKLGSFPARIIITEFQLPIIAAVTNDGGVR